MINPEASPPTHGHARKKRSGFNLVEAAIVLGVVGLVIGGLWIAAASVASNMLISNTSRDILGIVTSARQLFTRESFPTGSTLLYVASTLHRAGSIPASYALSGSNVISPDGVVIRPLLGCGTGACPEIRILVYVNKVNNSEVTLAECVNIIRRIAGPQRNTDSIARVQVNTAGGGGIAIHFPPIVPENVACPADTGYLEFWFKA